MRQKLKTFRASDAWDRERCITAEDGEVMLQALQAIVSAHASGSDTAAALEQCQAAIAFVLDY